MTARLVTVAALALALIACAVALVRVQHERRTLFIELQHLEGERDALRVDWGRLQLERSTWSTHDRVERIAVGTLGLSPPPADAIVLVTTR